MSTTNSDQEIVTLLTEKTKVTPKPAIYDDNGNLVELFLSGLNLSLVPSEIGQLTKLKTLNLSNNHLRQLPPEIEQLTSLQQLDLSNNQLMQLPPEIGQLTSLQQLSLGVGTLDTEPIFDTSLINALTQLPPEIGQLTSLQRLYLGRNQLTELPPEIGQLTSLQELDLSHNQLTQLPPEIGHLTSLQGLSLSHNQLTQLPPEIGQLTNLEILFITELPLTRFPSEVLQLINLKRFIWHSHNLSELPPEIGQLTSLQEIYMVDTQLSQIPSEICQLTSLRNLYLRNNQFTQLPPEIGQLTSLQQLNLSGNQLRQLPPEIRQLTSLQQLDLNDNQLRQLPPEIGQLTSLQRLNLSGNQLRQLPPEIGQLTSLQQLNLSGNQLRQLPPEIGQLTSLQEFDLSNNQLSLLPPEIGQLTNLHQLDLDNNPDLLTPPPEIVARGTKDTLAFLRELQQHSIERYESKLLIVGEGGTGKTSLLRALRGDTFEPHLSMTHGIEIGNLQLSYLHHNLLLHVWDFGGQHIYHATHQFFLTKRSLYIIVWNTRLGTGQGKLDYWLDTIKTLAPKAPVLLVATHFDEHAPDLNYQLYKDAYPQLVGSLAVSNLNRTGIAELKKALTEQAACLPLMGQQWPQKWLDVEVLLSIRSEQHIDAGTYVHCCVQCGVEEDIANGTVGNYLHDLGKILYFRDEDLLSNLVVLKPNWVTRAIARVLDDKAISEAKGIMQHADLPRIWARDEDGHPYERYLYPILLRLMERFELSYQIEADSPGENATKSLIPLLLPHQPPLPLPPWPKVPPKEQPQVEMVYRLDVVPAGIMSRFIVRTHRYTKNLHWREGVMLEYEKHQARIELNPMLREIKILVQGPLPQNFFNILMHTLNAILARFEGLTIRHEIPCICHWKRGVTEPCSRYYRYEDLVRYMEAGLYSIRCFDNPLIEVSVPEMLYGIHSSTNEQVIADIQRGQQEIQKQLRTLNKLHMLIEKIDQQSELIGRNFTRQWNLEMAKIEFECPNTFILQPSDSSPFNPKNWVSQEYRLFLMCQYPPQPHPVKTSYPLRQAEEWWVTISPWLNRLITFLKYGIPLAGKSLEVLLDEADVKQIQNGINLLEEIVKDSPQLPALDSKDRSTTVPILNREQEMIGLALRAFRRYLDTVDPYRIWGELYRTVTPDGHILWLCSKHRHHYEAKPLQL